MTGTAMQRRVAGLAAGGASNCDIAQTVFATRMTVESHLHAALHARAARG